MVRQIQGRYDVSERCACRFLGFERTALRYVPQRPLRDAPLRAKLREMAALYPRWGLPRLQWRLEREGMHVNHKRTERLYRLEGLAVRRRRRKRVAVPRVPRPVVTQPNDTWGIDFVSDQLASGRRFRCFTVVDHCTREAPGLTVAHSLPSEAVIRALDAMIDYLRDLRSRPVWRAPDGAARARFTRETLPDEGREFAAVLADFEQFIKPYATGNIHPMFMGWAQGAGTPAGMIADMLAAGMNDFLIKPVTKIAIAEKLSEVGVERIEAGMPAVSEMDFQAIKDISYSV